MTTETIERTETTDSPVFNLLASMTADSFEASTLDPQQFMLARFAALVAVDAPTDSYLANLMAASDLKIDADQVRGVLLAIAPIVGTARVVSATGKMARALGFAIETAEL